MNTMKSALSVAVLTALLSSAVGADEMPVLRAGDASLKEWRLPAAPAPADNMPTAARIDLGRHLFFDPRVSGDGNMSCGTCHNPALGWSDGMATARGAKSKVLGRATPSIVNAAYGNIMMWDGRKKNLEDQATGPMEAPAEMNTDVVKFIRWLEQSPGYRRMFDASYPGEGINTATLSKAIAAFERTVVMNDTPFDRWVAGDARAMTAQQVRGFGVFLDPKKGDCAVCHSAPNFTDDGFHNLGLASSGSANPDPGRFAQKPIARMKGAFKTPQLRGIALTAPYFHDGSAATLMDVVEHYDKGGVVTANLDPNLKPLGLSRKDKEDLVAFLNALNGSTPQITVPLLPVDHEPTVRLTMLR